MSAYRGLTVRHDDRLELRLPAVLTIEPEHKDQVRFSSNGKSVIDSHSINIDVRDVSKGGLGIDTETIVPRMALASIKVFTPADEKGTLKGTLLLERKVRIRRVSMITSEPRYLLGAQFITQESDQEEDINNILSFAEKFRKTNGGKA